jgi:hypothetical protein
MTSGQIIGEAMFLVGAGVMVGLGGSSFIRAAWPQYLGAALVCLGFTVAVQMLVFYGPGEKVF